jgi:hypothetical protein
MLSKYDILQENEQDQQIEILSNLYCVSNVTELESDAEKSLHRFTDYAG